MPPIVTTPPSGGIVITKPDQDPTDVEINGQDVPEGNISLNEDGDIVIDEEYLSRLPSGDHILSLNYNGMTSEALFTVYNPTPPEPTEPTEQYWSLFNLLATLITVFAAMAFFLLKRQDKQDPDDEAEEPFLTWVDDPIFDGLSEQVPPEKTQDPKDLTKEQKQDKAKARRTYLTVALILTAILNILLLIFTQDFTLQMAIWDNYSPIFGAVTLSHLLFLALGLM